MSDHINTEITLTSQQARDAIEFWLNEVYLKESISVFDLIQDYDTRQLRVEIVADYETTIAS